MILGAVSRQFTVRFGGSADNTKSIVYIGETGTVWNYPQVQVRDVLIGYNALTANVDGIDWAISYSTSLLNVSVSRTDVLPYASNANTLGGYSASGTVGANTVVIRDVNGYIYANYINSNVSETENPTINSFYTSNGDGWLRKSSVAHVKSQLGLGTMAYAATSSYVAKSGDTMTGELIIGNGTSRALRINTTVADTNTRDGIYLYEDNGQATGRQAISWYNGNTGYYKARLWTEVGSAYNATQFGIDVANDARTVATRLYIRNGDTYHSGDVIGYASDIRLKENIKSIENPIEKINKIRGVNYRWKDEVDELGFSPTKRDDVGVIAQEILDVIPEAVRPAPFDYLNGSSVSGENYLTVQYEKLVPLLIEGIKEQQTQIESLKKKNQEFETILNSLINR
jgi:uncharacterized membrane protein